MTMLDHFVRIHFGRLLLCAVLASTLLVERAAVAGDCACMPCDFDQDGDVDMADFGHLQLCLTGTGATQSNPACQDARLAGHAYIDQQDVAIFRACVAGEQQPYPETDVPVVVISEFMAANDGGLADEDGDHPDWIEIHVPCQPVLSLNGWFLTDDPANLQKWAFPDIMLFRGDYLVVFASGKDRRVAGQRLHTNFQLERNEGYLAVVRPDGQTVVHAYSPEYPEQLSNISYGLAQGSVSPVAKGAQASYLVPTQADSALGTAWTEPDFPDSAWAAGPTGLGFSSLPSAFQVTVYRSNIAVPNLATAESVIADPAKQVSVTTAQLPILNLSNNGAVGHFADDQTFPGMTPAANVDNYVTLVTGTIVIPAAGEWTFGVNSDDGFSLGLTLGTDVFTSSYPELRSPGDTMGIFNIVHPGVYSLRLVHFDQTGGSELELFTAKGYYETFDSAAFRLVGDLAGGGLSLGGIGADVLTNLGPAMHGVNSSVWMRIPFDLADPTGYTGMKLSIRYVDGFVAYLNGQEVTRSNAPADLSWAAAATAKRTGQAAATTEETDLSGFHTLLRPGRNVLAIHGLNETVADGDFAIVPELTISSDSMQPQYFPTPTPGQPNAPGVLDFVSRVHFSQERGFRNAAFQLSLTCSTAGAVIRYTLDGSTPTATIGLVYSGPLTINRTSIVRAAGFKAGWLPSSTATNTYLFVNDVIQQSPQGQSPGTGWPAPGNFSGQLFDYGMDPDIINDPRYSASMDDALLAIPSISLVTDLPNLFDATTGIYTHPGQDGRDWERPCSMELLEPSGKAGFQIDAGLRIRGGWSRSGDCPKHGFRLLFRSEYGEKSLDYPLFGSDGAGAFRKIDFRTEQDYSWSFTGDSHNTMVREVFSRDTEAALGDPYTRSRYYHLYIDGQYWGIYQTEERPEEEYAATYFGGDADNYDVVKVTAGSYTIYATAGNTDAWHRLWEACQAGFTSNTTYYKAQGLNPDGTRNSAYEVLLDVDNTIDCALITYYIGDIDGPTSEVLGNGVPNNFYVLRDRTGQSGFKCFKHDAEMAMFDVNKNRIGPWAAGQQFQHFNPQYLSECLMGNAEYRMRFADRVQKFFFNGGPLTPVAAAARFTARANQIQTAIIAESARWGDAKTHPALNRDDHWQPEINWVLNNYLPVRTGIVLEQLKAKGLYPTVAAPLFSNYGGQVQSGYGLVLSKPAGATGTIYYTTDGTDPRLRGGAVAPGAQVFASQPIIIDHNMAIKARVYSNSQWSALVEAVFVTQPAALVINEFMADNKTTIRDPDEPDEHPDWIEIYNPNPIAMPMGGMYLSDDPARPTQFQIAQGVSVPANGHLVFWADDDGTQGNLHTNFSLNKDGERIRLTAADGTTLVDEIVFGAQATDVSYGRSPDGSATWGSMAHPTPGQPNGSLP